ncbi:MAG: hypothetical protein N2712_07005 [Brevinematales bacterium]|nr:hypothetical protein [Brevinematales bacterium]
MKIQKSYITVLFIFVILTNLYGEADIGYYSIYSSPSDSYLNPANILNLKDTVNLQIQIFLSLKFSFLNDAITLKVSDRLNIHPNGGTTSVTNKINELLLSFYPYEWLILSLGKEVVRSGVGFFKNPSDFLINRKTLGFESKEDADKYLEGRIIASSHIISDIYSFQLAFSPRILWDSSSNKILDYLSSNQEEYKVLAKFSGNFYGLDVSPVFCYDEKINGGMNLSYVIGDNLEIHFEGSIVDRDTKKIIVDRDVVSNGIKIGTTNALESFEIKWIPKVIIGGHYTFSDIKFNIMFEYFYNGIGLDGKEWFSTLDKFEKNYNDISSGFPMLASFFLGIQTNIPNQLLLSLSSLNTVKEFIEHYGITGIVKHYGMLRAYKEFDIPLSLEFILVKNLVDLSGYVVNRFSYSLEIGKIEVGIGFPYGGKKSEFGLSLDRFVLFSSFKIII